MTNQKPTADEILDQFIAANEAIQEAEERLEEAKINHASLGIKYVAAYERENPKEKVTKSPKPHLMTKVMLARLNEIKLQIDTASDELLQLTKSLELPLIEPEFENPSWPSLGPY